MGREGPHEETITFEIPDFKALFNEVFGPEFTDELLAPLPEDKKVPIKTLWKADFEEEEDDSKMEEEAALDLELKNMEYGSNSFEKAQKLRNTVYTMALAKAHEAPEVIAQWERKKEQAD